LDPKDNFYKVQQLIEKLFSIPVSHQLIRLNRLHYNYCYIDEFPVDLTVIQICSIVDFGLKHVKSVGKELYLELQHMSKLYKIPMEFFHTSNKNMRELFFQILQTKQQLCKGSKLKGLISPHSAPSLINYHVNKEIVHLQNEPNEQNESLKCDNTFLLGTIYQIPSEIFCIILENLTPYDLIHTAQVSQHWKKFSLDEGLWEKVYTKYFPKIMKPNELKLDVPLTKALGFSNLPPILREFNFYEPELFMELFIP